MRARVESRLAELRNEYRAGQEQLQEVVLRENALRETLLRISGAVQVLEELAEQEQEQDTGPTLLRPTVVDPGGDGGDGATTATHVGTGTPAMTVP